MARNITRGSSMILLMLSSLIACSSQPTVAVVPTPIQVAATAAPTSPSTATPVPTLPPTAIPPTPTQSVFTFPAGSRIAGTDVGGLTVDAATEQVGTAI